MSDFGDADVGSTSTTGHVRTLMDSDVNVAAELLSGAVRSGRLVTVFGHCVVDYEGRAASELAPGDRHLMIHPDGTTLVHTDEGQQPLKGRYLLSRNEAKRGATGRSTRLTPRLVLRDIPCPSRALRR